MGTVALVLGILSIIPCAIAFGSGALLAIPAIILGFVARGKAKRGEATNKGVATAGVITGIVGLVIALAWGGLIIFGAIEFGDEFENFTDCLEEADNDNTVTDAERLDCEDQFEDDLGGN